MSQAGPYIVCLTSSKGGVGKSTLAVNLAGALAVRGRTALIDADPAVGTSTRWAGPIEAVEVLAEGERPAADTRYLVLDTEGRPGLPDMVDLSHRAGAVLIPTSPAGPEMESTWALWQALKREGANLERVRIVLTRVPPVGREGEQAREDLRQRGANVAQTLVRQYKVYQQAAPARVLVRDYPNDKAAAAWGDILALALEVC